MAIFCNHTKDKQVGVIVNKHGGILVSFGSEKASELCNETGRGRDQLVDRGELSKWGGGQYVRYASFCRFTTPRSFGGFAI